MSSLPWLGFYGFCVTAALLWVPPLRQVWPGFAALTLGLLVASGVVLSSGAVWLGATVLALFAAARLNHRRLATAAYLAGMLLVLALSAHLLPGFKGYQLIPATHITPDSVAYARWFGADKAFAGLLFLALIGPTIASRAEWQRMLVRAAPIAAVTTVVVLGAALAAQFVAVSPKWSPLFVTFALSNLFLTCIPEEVVFRRIIQGALARRLEGRRYGAVVAVVVSGTLFGLAHVGGGAIYAALATLAGLGYGYAYQATGRIEAAILAHFALNLTHFVVFTYPALA